MVCAGGPNPACIAGLALTAATLYYTAKAVHDISSAVANGPIGPTALNSEVSEAEAAGHAVADELVECKVCPLENGGDSDECREIVRSCSDLLPSLGPPDS